MAFKDEKHRKAVDSLQTAELLKSALMIVDELSYYDFDDIDDQENLEKLIEKAKKLTRHRLWKLK
jgi:hypothetical protein